jgi:outer membrane protein insertion porin family
MGLRRALGVFVKSALILAFWILWNPYAHAQGSTLKKPVSQKAATQAFTISEIRVDGNKKIETTAITEKMSIKADSQFDNSKVRDDIQALYDMGYFEDIQFAREGTQLIVTVVEKPSISAIEFEGNDELDDEELTEKSGLKTFEMVNYSKIQKAISEIQKAYEEKGYLLAKVDFSLKPEVKTPQSSRLIFKVTENQKVQVKRVSFVGNKKVPAQDLKAFMATQEGGFFSFVSGSGTYKQDMFDDDVKRLSMIYFNKGYVQAQIFRPEVSVTPDKKGIYISIKIDEGEQFQTGEVDFSGDLLFDKSELKEETKIDDSEDFSYEIVQGDLRALEAKYGDLGYAYANLIPRTQILAKERKVNITYEIEKGQKVYFRRVNVIGNTSTRDKVIRRELRFIEGELYNETHKRNSLANIKRLGYFEDVQFMTKTPPGRDDQMDIDVVVKERNTGQFQLGAGYATALGAQLNVQLDESNFMGYGYRAGVRVEYNGARYQNYTVSFTDPYFNDSFWSIGTDMYYTDSRVLQFVQQNKGASLRGGHPLFFDYFQNNNFYAFLRYKIDETFVSFASDQDVSDVLNPATVNGVTSSVQGSLEFDKRNDRMMPSDGVYASASYEFAGLGGDIKFMKSQMNARYYKNLFWDVVFRNNLSYGIMGSVDDKPLPFTELFRLGGPNNLRGYAFRNVGTRKFSAKRYNALAATNLDQAQVAAACAANFDGNCQQAFTVVGGSQQLFYMAELEFPLAKEAGMRAVIFYDIGQAENNIDSSNFRADIGFGIRWFSPMGPLRFEFGFPLDRQAELGERSNNFQFAVGSPF